MIQGLVGFALHNVASSGMQRWAEHAGVTAGQLRTALAQVKADSALFESESNTLKSEYLVLRNTMTSPGWAGEIGDTLGGPLSDGLMPARVAHGFLWMMGEPELTVRFARQIVANQIREVDKPLAERRKLVGSGFATLYDTDPTVARVPGELDANQLDRAVKSSILAKLLLPATNQFDIAVLRFRGRQAALEVLFAAQAYRRDHGEFPESLHQLVPQYLEAVPLDPCDPHGGRLRYRRDAATTAVVWSVGDDGADHEGDVESETGRPADVGFTLKTTEPK